ncbi:uncharacterized protein LOC126802985 [Argentina anserina]|uniref:uncharacterized protein LOC126802985 n=1 Tax=Argentina anserina TaxID=57926 RepID=UPI002176550B|nr:uncharacterized protein LOC126802985 [Potentilla anserina]
MQKFKLLATQCAVVTGKSPTHSPTASPVIHLRRRKTLRMFLSRRIPRPSDSPNSDDDDGLGDANDRPPEKSKEARVRRKLKDLFVSSPPLERGREVGDGDQLGLLSATDGGGVGGLARTRRGGVFSRPLTASLRCRLLRRAWRPVLVSIPESER